MRVTVMRFEGSYAVCMEEDYSIINIKRFYIPLEAEEGDILTIEESAITIGNKVVKEKYIHVDDVILERWYKTKEISNLIPISFIKGK